MRYVVNGTVWLNGRQFSRVDVIGPDTANGVDFLNSPIALVQKRQDADFIASALNSRCDRAPASTDPLSTEDPKL